LADYIAKKETQERVVKQKRDEEERKDKAAVEKMELAVKKAQERQQQLLQERKNAEQAAADLEKQELMLLSSWRPQSILVGLNQKATAVAMAEVDDFERQLRRERSVGREGTMWSRRRPSVHRMAAVG
jgi:uncharacterized protein YlxW (UPF0749 family)